VKKLKFPLILSIALILTFTTCKKDLENGNTIKKEKVSGFVQKGPFINGTQILMSELNPSLEQTGKVFSTQISNSLGSFEISNVQLSSSFVEFNATGFYFDEVKNDISSAPLTLQAISDIEDISTINVNILTHLEKRRVEFLIKENSMSFEDAKQTAQTEVLAAFGISADEMQASETLNISVDNNDNAILLAISLILQGNRNVGELSELLALTSSDLRENGVIDNEETLNNLRSSTLALGLDSIRDNLVARYQDLNVPASIPDFESYIAVFLDFTSQPPTVTVPTASDIKAFSATLNGLVNANSSPTVVSFEYGTSTEFDNIILAVQSPVTGVIPQSVSAEITGLQHNTTYYFRVTSENEEGTIISDMSSFTTTDGQIILTTNDASDITINSAISGGIITDDGGTPITARGVVWSINANPTLNDNYTTDGEGNGSFTSEISDLTHATVYYLRAYATNAVGTSYGNQISFSTQDGIIILYTSPVNEITNVSAISGGNITDDGGDIVMSRGIVWGTFENPTIESNEGISDNGTGTGSFVSNLTNLNVLTKYYVRAYATNSTETKYGNQIDFMTNLGVDGEPCPGTPTVTDIEGNVYNTVAIGYHCWMKENLKTTTYRNGTSIPNVTDNNAWKNLITGANVWYDNDISWKDSYGALYNWYTTIDPNGLCPTGWHAPTNDEWTALTDYIGGTGYSNELKSCRQVNSPLGGVCNTSEHPRWEEDPYSDNYGTDDYGFSGLPGGSRESDGPFGLLGRGGYWWSSTEGTSTGAWAWGMHYDDGDVITGNATKQAGFSVRCIKD